MHLNFTVQKKQATVFSDFIGRNTLNKENTDSLSGYMGLEEPMSCGGLRVRRAVLETLNVEVVVVVAGVEKCQ